MPRELKADRLLQEISELQLELRNHQGRCKHKNSTYTSHSNTGNWDHYDDIYWQVWKCPTCKKSWTVDV